MIVYIILGLLALIAVGSIFHKKGSSEGKKLGYNQALGECEAAFVAGYNRGWKEGLASFESGRKIEKTTKKVAKTKSKK